MKIIYPLGIIGLLMRYIGTLVLSFRTGEIDWTYGGYSRFPCVVFSVAVFVWFWYHDWTFIVQKTRCKNIVRIMSKASFGVYLTHFYILRFFVEQFEIPMRAWQWRILGVPCVYLLALGVTILLQKIPVINKIIP